MSWGKSGEVIGLIEHMLMKRRPELRILADEQAKQAIDGRLPELRTMAGVEADVAIAVRLSTLVFSRAERMHARELMTKADGLLMTPNEVQEALARILHALLRE